MSYRALYRKYRPQKFSDVSDQEYITRTLINAIKLGKTSHAYLFNGPRGVGKTTIARIFAKAINCENLSDGEPCDECDICKSITNGSNPDIIEIDAASRTKVEQMRETLEKVNFLPSMSKYKVYIIDEVHMLSASSFNALLKTLEEPPKHVVFILCTTEVDKVIPTIRSRCQRFDFHLISKEGLTSRLEYVVKEEGIKIEKEAISLIAEASEGGMRDALSLLDQISAFSITDTITADDVLEVSGNVSTNVLLSMCDSINENNSSRAIVLLDSLIKMGKEVEKITQGLITFYKDILIMKNTDNKIEKSGYEKEEFLNLVKGIDNSKIYKYIEILTGAMSDFRYSTNKRLYLELAIIKMCDKNEFVGGVIPTINTSKNESTSKPYDPNKVYPTPTFNKPIVEEKKVEENITIASDEKNEPNKPIIESESKIPEAMEFNFDEKPISMVSEPKKEEKEIAKEIKDENKIESVPIKEEIKESTNDGEFDIHIIEEILNNANKPFKESLISKLEDAKHDSKGTDKHKYALLLDGGSIQASSEKSFVITFKEVGHCNLVMKEENIKGIHDFILEYTSYDLTFIALPFEPWKAASDEYVRIYRANYANNIKAYINLTPVKCPGLKINKKEENNTQDNDEYKGLIDLFGDELTIK